MRQVFGGLLMGLGILIGALSGLCTVFAVGSTLIDPGSYNELTGILPAVLIVGGVPFMAGVGLFFAGRSLLRDRAGTGYAPPASPPPAPLDPETMAHPDPDRDGQG
jgi:hypothetical protein